MSGVAGLISARTRLLLHECRALRNRVPLLSERSAARTKPRSSTRQHVLVYGS